MKNLLIISFYLITILTKVSEATKPISFKENQLHASTPKVIKFLRDFLFELEFSTFGFR